jgi:membrane-bound lytic murein transglycosylase B
MSKVNATLAAALAGAVFMTGGQVLAAQCNHKGGFPAFVADFKKEAAQKGISKRGLAALDGVTLDQTVLSLDKRQGVFRQSFEQFSARMISRDRLTKGAKLMHQYAGQLKRIEQQYGVPPAVVVAIWGLETDYGVNQGKMSVVRSVATLAYDCRRGDMASADMHGDWAGEIGQTQFLPSSYAKYAVSYEGRGKPNLIRNAPDVLASTANYLKNHGWQRGKGWGPGEPNFEAIKEWNAAEVYAKTIASFADKLNGGNGSKADNPAPQKKPAARSDRRATR